MNRRHGLIAGLSLFCGSGYALDLGKLGPTREIAEPNLLEDIARRLREKERSGALRHLMEEARDRNAQAVRSPAPNDTVTSATTRRTYYVDPSFVLDRNVVDAQGRLLFAAGTRKNPLDVISLTRQLMFFDGRDPRQVRRTREMMDAPGAALKPILTAGSYLALMKAWHAPVYYDQQGVLVRRLGIRHVPALVSQEGNRLRIDEMVLP